MDDTMLSRLLSSILFMAVPFAVHAQVPPPPSLPGQDELSALLAAAIEAKNVAAYAALLSDDAHVVENEKQIAASKTEWMKTYGKKLTAEGVWFKIPSVYSSSGRLLFIEYFNSQASWAGKLPSHCCWSYDAVAYDIAGGKIAVIRRLRGGDKKLDAHDEPAR